MSAPVVAKCVQCGRVLDPGCIVDECHWCIKRALEIEADGRKARWSPLERANHLLFIAADGSAVPIRDDNDRVDAFHHIGSEIQGFRENERPSAARNR